MKIAHVIRRISFSDWGGTEQVVWNLAKAQLAAGHDVRLFATTALYAQGHEDLAPSCPAQDVLHPGVPAGVAQTCAKRLLRQLVNITPDYTRGDKIVTWVVFCYSIIYKFIIAFVLAAIISRVRHWGAEQWGGYFFVVSVVVPAAVGLVTTVWFGIGTVRDLKRLFHDLENRVRDNADNGFVAK